MYISKDFPHTEITLNSRLQAVACTVRFYGRNIDICSLYIPPDFNNSELSQDLNALVSQFKNPFLLLGDFNAHSLSDQRGYIVEDFVNVNNLVILNKGDDTHFSFSHNTSSAIDLTICSPAISTFFEWSVDSDVHDSDHYPIKVHITSDVSADAIPGYIPRWNLQKANWTVFQELSVLNEEEFISPEHAIHFFTNKILEAASESIPKTSPPARRRPVPWWTPEVAQAVARRKRAFRTYIRHPDIPHLVARNHERAKAKRVIREAKRKSWQSFVSQFTIETPLNKIWKIVRSLSGKRNISSIHPLFVENTLVTDPTVIVNTLAKCVQKCSSSDNYDVTFIANSRVSFRLPQDAFLSDNTEHYNSPFSIIELEEAIKSTGNTSVGPDGLHYQFFRRLPQESVNFLLTVFNDLWVKHIFPDAWKEAIVIPLPKPGKDHSNPEHYRPITLSSCLGKLLEKMVVKRLAWLLENNQILSKFQSGFRKKYSTMDHIIRIETDIRKGFKEKKCTTAIFLDVSRAYDMVYKPALIFKLHKIGLKGHMAHYLKNFLTDPRTFQLRCRSKFSDPHIIQNGLPQGSCLSPILFNIMINDLFDDIPQNISHSLFADDSAIWCSDKDPSHSFPRLQNALNKIDRWSRKNGFIFSAPKSPAVIFF